MAGQTANNTYIFTYVLLMIIPCRQACQYGSGKPFEQIVEN